MNTLMDRCVAAVFVSPMHAGIWTHVFPHAKDKKIIVRPQIDPDTFVPTYEHKYSRVYDKYLYVGTIAKGKGYLDSIEYAKRQCVDVVTFGDVHHSIHPTLLRNWHDSIPHNQLPRVYSMYKYFIHLPQWPEPQGRTVTEALLCGCTAICNFRVGALSYAWLDEFVDRTTYNISKLGRFQRVSLARKDKQYRSIIRNAPAKFWKDVEAALSGKEWECDKHYMEEK